MEILYEDNHIIVVLKPANVPVQADSSKDLDLLSMLKGYLKNKYNKPGNVYVGLIHRLDRPVEGIMVFAKTSKAASRLSEQIRNNNINKKYIALVHGHTKEHERLVNYIIRDEKNNKSKISTSKEGKEAILEYDLLRYVDDKSLITINLYTGRHHQIRVQLSNINHSIYGDQKYGIDKEGIQIHLCAFMLEFKHPVKDEIMSFDYKPKWSRCIKN